MKHSLDKPVKITRRKGQKRLYVRAKKDHYLISAPKNMPTASIERFLKEHREKISNLRQYHDPEDILFLKDTLTLFGDERPLLFMRRGEEGLSEMDDAYVFVTGKRTDQTIREALKKTLKGILVERLEAIHEHYRSTHPQVCDRKVSFKTQYMKSRFGSAVPGRGTISVNLVMVHYDERYLHYIYAHEISHFLHPDHSSAFYRTLSSLMPEHEKEKRDLKATHDAYISQDMRL